MRRAFLLAFLSIVAACSPRSGPPEETSGAPVESSRRERDSVLARSKIPMAGAVGKAMGAADAASAQAAAHDSLLR